jgi:signal transduction histidine kinase
MAEQKATGVHRRLTTQLTKTIYPQTGLYLLGTSPEEPKTQSLDNVRSEQPRKDKAPSWLRPFFSLRIQLTFAYTLLLILVMAFSYLLLNQQESPALTVSMYMLIGIVVLILIGAGLTYVVTSLLLRPLSRVTDAAQAIAIGDLEQRVRLPLRLPPQDEVDRLAGSLNEMVSRLEHAEELQVTSQERFRQFFSDASHQLRTPLTSIRGFTELLMRGAKDDPETSQRILTRMKNESERMTFLINDLLTLARLDDTHPLKLQYLDIVEIAIEEIKQARTRAADERTISLHVATSERLGIQADRERIKQLFFILLDNALKYGRPAPEGEITLKIDKLQNQVMICLINNGEGIACEDMEHIFEAFYRGRHRSASNSQIIGTGLGLTIASAIVRSHNGAISVCSESDSTEFTVLLPYTD